MEQNKVKFFICRLKINTLVEKSLSFVAVFLLESLEGILIAKLLIELGLVAKRSRQPLSFLLQVMENATKLLKMPEKPATTDQ